MGSRMSRRHRTTVRHLLDSHAWRAVTEAGPYCLRPWTPGFAIRGHNSVLGRYGDMAGRKLTVTREAARRFLVSRHCLAPPRAVQGGMEAVMEVVRRLGSIQLDPVAVAGRNHD